MAIGDRARCYKDLMAANRAHVVASLEYYRATVRVFEAKLQCIDRGSPIHDEEPMFAALAQQRHADLLVLSTKHYYEAALNSYYDALQSEEE